MKNVQRPEEFDSCAENPFYMLFKIAIKTGNMQYLTYIIIELAAKFANNQVSNANIPDYYFEDLVNETYIEMAKNNMHCAKNFRKNTDKSLKSYICKIMVNIIKSKIKMLIVERNFFRVLCSADQKDENKNSSVKPTIKQIKPVFDINDELLRRNRELVETLVMFLKKFPNRKQNIDILMLKYAEVPPNEIAVMYSTTVGNIYAIISRTLTYFRTFCFENKIELSDFLPNESQSLSPYLPDKD